MSADYLDIPVSLDDFRKLIGLPSERLPLPTGRLPRWWPTALSTNARRTEDPENNIGIYENIIYEERRTLRSASFYDILANGSLIAQLIISALLILLAATPNDHHITLAILGAFNGVITGVLSLIRGQGLPNRFLEYADGLRKVRERVEWLEKELEAGKREVRYKEVVDLKEMYERIREDEQKNRPDTWTPSNGSSARTSEWESLTAGAGAAGKARASFV
ncbi:hypothetical protein K432DRAFT_381335 [Lepidopterella palustris CBS 459.81]|uniref:SMODS and SLOG-associating 2TM effector domain-containing protein n=1 Tax=Lepidopterella palustris CBS 459.81 TaxID=1314670 RepID=A0A8E2ECF9_9PEZI|nr:hypothetical protein K432DRAFT_381335 [Lepidopterella palustris CBS 459.81]